MICLKLANRICRHRLKLVCKLQFVLVLCLKSQVIDKPQIQPSLLIKRLLNHREGSEFMKLGPGHMGNEYRKVLNHGFPVVYLETPIMVWVSTSQSSTSQSFILYLIPATDP